MQTLLKSLSTYPANDVYLETLFNNAPRGYQHQPYVNPLEGVSEAFAKGVYEAPGELVRLLEAFGEYQGGRKSSKPYSRAVDDFTQVNEMGYNPDDYGASPLLQSLARFGGNVVGDPLNAIPGAYVGKQAAVKTGQVADDLARLLGKESLRHPMRNQAGMVAYHGSPHKFDRFDHSKMGTGEGAQAYGWGTYIAENPKVAKEYSHLRPITDQTDTAFITARSALAEGQGDIGKALKALDASEQITKDAAKFIVDGGKSELDDIAKAREMLVSGSMGESNLYRVDLPDEKIAQMLDWDAPLSEQPESVLKAIEADPRLSKMIVDRQKYREDYLTPKLTDKYNPLAADDFNRMKEPTGQDLYEMVQGLDVDSFGFNIGNAQENASKRLNKLGIPGIKYFDGNSRTAGNGTRNFVVFDENDLSILERNGEKLQQSLPMDEASRMARAREMGNTTDAYHGTTHDIERFDATNANPESDWGAATYTSTSIDDINPNYAGEGPDLTQRIQTKAEQLADEMDLDYNDPKVLALARKEIKGGSEGAVYPLKINTEKYANIGGKNSTRLTDETDYFDLAKSEINKSDYSDEWEYLEAVEERMYELKADNLDSLENRIYNALTETDAYNQDPEAVSEVMDSVNSMLANGEINLSKLDDVIRTKIQYIEDYDTGQIIGAGHTSKQVFENLGFEGVIDNTVDAKFGSSRAMGQKMEGVYPDTVHIVTFPGYEKNIRSKFAKFDPSKKDSANILAGGAAVGINEEDRNRLINAMGK